MSSKEGEGFLVIDLEPRPLSAPRPVRPEKLALIPGPVEDTLTHNRRNGAGGFACLSLHRLARARA